MYQFSIFIQVIWITLFCCTDGVAETSIREQRYAKQFDKYTVKGEPVQLGGKNGEFLGIFHAAETAQPKGGVLILHDVGTHLDWQSVIHPLRTQLPQKGWNTLAIMLPVFEGLGRQDIESSEAESLRRIAVAVAYFGRQSIYNIVIAGYGYGGAMAISFADNNKAAKTIRAVVLISTYNPLWDLINRQTSEKISTLPYPVLDIIGAHENTAALGAAAQRKKSAVKSGNDNYRQISIIGSNHSYFKTESTLLNRIVKWINKQAPSMELKIRNQALPPNPDGK